MQRANESSPHTDLLFDLVNGLNVDYYLERSVKLAESRLRGERYLLTVDKRSMGHGSYAAIAEVCRGLNMPKPLLKMFHETYPNASSGHVRFGVELNERRHSYKVYLGFAHELGDDASGCRNPPSPFLLCVAFKWDGSDSERYVVTRYTCHPRLPFEEIRARMAGVLGNGTPLDIGNRFLDQVSSRIPHNDVFYLDVADDNSRRCSFDINVYRSRLTVEDVSPLLETMRRYYCIPAEKFRRLYESIRSRPFGHLAGGTDKRGSGFFTVYHGVDTVRCGSSASLHARPATSM